MPTGPILSRVTPGLQNARPSPSHIDAAYFAALETDSYLPEVQEVIREAIRTGLVRVEPVPGCPTRVRIKPTANGGPAPRA